MNGLASTLSRWLLIFAALITGMALGILGLAFLLANEVYEYQDSVDGVHLPEVDAIVCLAGGRGRIAAAGDLWYRYWELTQASKNERPLPALYISGMGPHSNWGGFTRQIRSGVRGVIKAQNVVLETESGNTDANARLLSIYGQAHGWERILLVTSPYHMKRARFIFDRILRASTKPIAVETLSIYQEPFEPGEWRYSLHGIRVTLVEFLKLLYYRTFWKS